MKRLTFVVFFLASMVVWAQNSFAATNCTPVYGGGEVCNNGTFVVEKTVLNPKTNTFVANLTKNDPTYQPSFIVTFQIKVINTSQETINKITLNDVFPKGVTFSSGEGIFDNATQTLTFDATNLAAGKSMLFTIIGRVASDFTFPQNESPVCIINQVFATTDTKKTNQDSTQFCISKTAQKSEGTKQMTQSNPDVTSYPLPKKITKTPATGPEAITFISLLPIGGLGLFLRKKTHLS